MIPEGIKLNKIYDKKSNLTFKADFDKDKIRGKTDELEVVKQAVFLLLSTERDYSPIYKDYGIKTVDLIGKDFYYVISEIKRRITEALLSDDRIKGIENFKYEQNENLVVTFDVICVYGDFIAEGVMNV